MRIAVHGVVADFGASGAGAFVLLLKTLLDEGHTVHFYGVPAFSRPKSLEGRPRFTFTPLRLEAVRWMNALIKRLDNRYASAGGSQLGMLAYQREAIRSIERAHAREPYAFILCLDAINLWPSTLPVLSWPQSPPQTEWEALRRPGVAALHAGDGNRTRANAVHAFYAFRWAQARVTQRFSDLVLCGSEWALEGWRRFGVPRERLTTIPYPVEAAEHEGSAPPGRDASRITFLWLGRAVPRKRLDLFLHGFERVRDKYPDARALLVGNLSDPASRKLLEPYLSDPTVELKGSVPRSEVASLLASVDVVVQPSEHENFGFAVAEALAAGRPVVLGRTNGTLDYAGSAGFVFDAYEPESVATAMERARAAVRARGAELSEAARAAAREHFAPARVTERLRRVAGDVIAASATPRGRHA
jgi:glycosyltransferase involved in cell wall biosynthesis